MVSLLSTFDMDTTTVCPDTQTPLSSPYLTPSMQPILLQDLQKVLLDIIKAVSKAPDSASLFDSLDQATSKPTEVDQARVKASKLDYKAVNEMCVLEWL